MLKFQLVETSSGLLMSSKSYALYLPGMVLAYNQRIVLGYYCSRSQTYVV